MTITLEGVPSSRRAQRDCGNDGSKGGGAGGPDSAAFRLAVRVDSESADRLFDSLGSMAIRMQR